MTPDPRHSSGRNRQASNSTRGRPLTVRDQPGYYPGFSTLAQQKFWDAATREKILARVTKVPTLRYFTREEAALFDVIADHLIPQDDRPPEKRIPITPFVDERLFAGRIPGYRFTGMPPDREAHRLGLQAIAQMARETYEKEFLKLTWRQQDNLLKTLHDGRPAKGAEEIWQKMSLQHFWSMLVGDCVDVYYAHPWAWDEIGFGGPAYPRPYFRLEHGDPEPWEVDEKRYLWSAPTDCVSDPIEPEIPQQGGGSHGQGGTH